MGQTEPAEGIIPLEDAGATIDRARGATERTSNGLFPPLRGFRYGSAMAILLALYIANFLDRLVVNILAEPIKRELVLADWQLGVLTGLSFALFYTVLGIPIARLAERHSRPVIISVSAAAWSVFTLACGFVQNFSQLVTARVGVGVGEAGLTPAAHSLIMDYARRDKRNSALALYGLGAPIGTTAGMAFGGLIADHYGWRAAFLIAGAPGLLFAILALVFLPEPRRVGVRLSASSIKVATTLGGTIGILASKRSFRGLFIAILFAAIGGYGSAPFIASFYLRNHSTKLAELSDRVSAALGLHFQSIGFLGLILGVVLGIFSISGMYFAGKITDRLAQRHGHWCLTVPAIVSLAAVPFWMFAMSVPDLSASLALLGLHSLFAGGWYGPAYASAYSLVSPQMRATTSAIVLFAVNLTGLGIGPLAVGITSDIFARTVGAAEGLRWALIIFGGCGLAAAALFAWGGRWFEREIEASAPL